MRWWDAGGGLAKKKLNDMRKEATVFVNFWCLYSVRHPILLIPVVVIVFLSY